MYEISKRFHILLKCNYIQNQMSINKCLDGCRFDEKYRNFQNSINIIFEISQRGPIKKSHYYCLNLLFSLKYTPTIYRYFQSQKMANAKVKIVQIRFRPIIFTNSHK